MSGVLHRQVGPGIFACGAKAADGARGTPRPDKVECGLCKRAIEAKQNKRKTSLRLLTDIRDRLLTVTGKPRTGKGTR